MTADEPAMQTASRWALSPTLIEKVNRFSALVAVLIVSLGMSLFNVNDDSRQYYQASLESATHRRSIRHDSRRSAGRGG